MSVFHISIAAAEDAAEILALQRLAYESEARLYNDWSIPPMTQSLESLIAEIKTETVLKATEGPSIIGSVSSRRCVRSSFLPVVEAKAISASTRALVMPSPALVWRRKTFRW